MSKRAIEMPVIEKALGQTFVIKMSGYRLLALKEFLCDAIRELDYCADSENRAVEKQKRVLLNITSAADAALVDIPIEKQMATLKKEVSKLPG